MSDIQYVKPSSFDRCLSSNGNDENLLFTSSQNENSPPFGNQNYAFTNPPLLDLTFPSPSLDTTDDSGVSRPTVPIETTSDLDSTLSTAGLSRTFSLPASKPGENEATRSRKRVISNLNTANTSHLFWVPASQHPEIAPKEFEKFLQQNALAKRERNSLRRRSSILSVSFTASDAEQEEKEEEKDQDKDGRQASLDALERKLVSDTTEAHDDDNNNNNNSTAPDEGDQGSERKSRLRRSISLGMMNAEEDENRVPDFLVFDRNSSALDESPVLVPRSDRTSLLRRGARTKFQRNSSFTPSGTRPPRAERMRHSESMPPPSMNQARYDLASLSSEGGVTLTDNPVKHEDPEPKAAPPAPEIIIGEQKQEHDTKEVQSLAIADHSTPSSSNSSNNNNVIRPPSPSFTPPPPPPAPSSPPPPPPPEHTHESRIPAPTSKTEKKSSWSWGFKRSKSEQVRSDPGRALTVPDQHNDATPRPRPSSSSEVPSSSSSSSSSRRSVFSSLFSRKSSNKTAPAETGNNTAPTPPKDFQLNRINQNRLPIHIERAIYRLSHMKLANPRRPLQEQVLISNLMFWYLSVVSSSHQSQDGSDNHNNNNNNDTNNNKPRMMGPAAGKRGKRRPPSGIPSSNNKAQLKGDDGVSLQQYMGNGKDSTGFVVPENYLRPQQQKQESATKNNGGGRGNRPRRSVCDSDEDEDDDEEEEDSDSSNSSDDDDKPCRPIRTAPGRQAMAERQRDKKMHNTQSRKAKADDDVPLSMYRKSRSNNK